MRSFCKCQTSGYQTNCNTGIAGCLEWTLGACQNLVRLRVLSHHQVDSGSFWWCVFYLYILCDVANSVTPWSRQGKTSANASSLWIWIREKIHGYDLNKSWSSEMTWTLGLLYLGQIPSIFASWPWYVVAIWPATLGTVFFLLSFPFCVFFW